MRPTRAKFSLDFLHLLYVCVFILLATGYLHEVLFQDRHLSAFDFILDKPAWETERGPSDVNNPLLADSPTAHYPYKKIFWGALQQGSNTDYLPHILTGQPSTGQGTGIFLTSIFQLFMDVPNALDWSTWFRLILAGIFMYALMVYLGFSPIVAALAGIAWTYNTHQMVWLLFPQHLATQLWIPFIFLLNLRLIRDKPDWPSFLGLILSVIFFYSSGYTQIVLYTFIFIGVFNTIFLITRKGRLGDKVWSWLTVHAFYVIAALLLIPDVIAQMNEISEGLRGAQRFRYQTLSSEYSFASLFGLLSDCLPKPLEVVRFLSAHYLGGVLRAPGLQEIYQSNDIEFRAFFGFIGAYLTLYGICGGLRRRDRLAIALTMVLFFLFTLFNKNPIMVGLVNLVPLGGAGEFDRFLTLILFVSIVLSGYGLHYFLEDNQRRRQIWGALPFAVLIAWIGIAKFQYDALVNLWVFLPSIMALTGFILIGYFLARRNYPNGVGFLVVLFTLYELFPATYSFNTRVDAENHFPTNSVIDVIQQTPGDFRTALVMSNTSYHHNILTYYKLATIGGYATTVRNEYIRFLQHAYGEVAITLNGVVFLMGHNPEILRLLNTKFIVTDVPIISTTVNEISRNDANALYAIHDPLERVYCASDQVIVQNSAMIPDRLAEVVGRFDRPVLVTKKLVQDTALTENCSISNLNVYQGRIEFRVTSDKPSLIFSPVNYHKNWRAKINGATAEIAKGNYAFMVIPIPAGASDVQLQYQDQNLVIGAMILVVLGFLVLLYGARSRGPTWLKLLFVFCGLLLVGKNVLSVPGIKNVHIPERQVSIETRGTTLTAPD